MRRYVLAIMLALFIGTCTVLGEALVPNQLPPEGTVAWLAFLGTVFLFGFTFVCTVVFAAYLDKVADSVPWGDLSGLKRRLPKVVLATVLLAVVAVAVWKVAEPSKLIKNHRTGGLDLAGYCRTYGYTANDQDACSWNIPLDQACEWQYNKKGLHVVLPSGPHSGICLTSRNKPVNGGGDSGIRDMGGFCQSRFATSTDVTAGVNVQQKWICRVRLDLNLACSWQYQKRDIKARQDGGLWYCYR